MALKMKNFNIGFTEKSDFLGWLGWFHKKPIQGELPKKEDLGQFADLRVVAWQEKEGVVFLGRRGVDTPMYTMKQEEWLRTYFF